MVYHRRLQYWCRFVLGKVYIVLSMTRLSLRRVIWGNTGLRLSAISSCYDRVIILSSSCYHRVIILSSWSAASGFEKSMQVLSCGDNVLFCGLVHEVNALYHHLDTNHYINFTITTINTILIISGGLCPLSSRADGPSSTCRGYFS